MKAVAEKGGGLYSAFKDYTITTVAVKTGTAEKASGLPNALIVGFAPADDPQIAMLIFFAVGIRLMTKAVRNERIEEHLENDLGIKRFVLMVARTGIYTILVGIAFGFLGTNATLLLIMTLIVTIAFVIGGMYTGYHLGFDSKTVVYVVGAILLWISGFNVLLSRVIEIF